MQLLAELKRRNVIRVLGLYLVGAWLITQVSSTVLPMFGAPDWLPRSIVILLAIAFVPALIFAWVYELTPEGLRREREIARSQSITPHTGRRMDRAIIVMLALALVYFALDKFVLAPRRDAQQPAVVVIPEKSIAVLPLANASGDKDQQYFSDGLSENLIIALSRFDGLTVIGRNSAFQFRDTKDDSRTIGNKLGVAHLLEGSVQRAGDVVRVSAELISAANGRTLWSERYDRPYKDLFALQDEITNAVAAALKAQLLVAAPAQTDRPPSGNLEAYSAYLQGRFYFAHYNEDDFGTALKHFAHATQLDPGYALAWAGQSRAASTLAAAFLDGAAAQDAYAQARASVAKALEIAPDMAAAHAAQSFMLLAADLDWAGAEREGRRAVELAPNDAVAKADLSRALAANGKIEEAVDQMHSALATDPLDSRSHSWLARYLLGLGRIDEAKLTVDKAIELQPTAASLHYELAIIQILRGDAKAAREAALLESGSWKVEAIALAAQIGGDKATADEALKKQLDEDAEGGAFQIAQTYALRNDANKTFEWLERALTQRDPGLIYLLHDSLILRFRDDARFAAFCRRARLPTTTSAKSIDQLAAAKAGH